MTALVTRTPRGRTRRRSGGITEDQRARNQGLKTRAELAELQEGGRLGGQVRREQTRISLQSPANRADLQQRMATFRTQSARYTRTGEGVTLFDGQPLESRDPEPRQTLSSPYGTRKTRESFLRERSFGEEEIRTGTRSPAGEARRALVQQNRDDQFFIKALRSDVESVIDQIIEAGDDTATKNKLKKVLDKDVVQLAKDVVQLVEAETRVKFRTDDIGRSLAGGPTRGQEFLTGAGVLTDEQTEKAGGLARALIQAFPGVPERRLIEEAQDRVRRGPDEETDPGEPIEGIGKTRFTGLTAEQLKTAGPGAALITQGRTDPFGDVVRQQQERRTGSAAAALTGPAKSLGNSAQALIELEPDNKIAKDVLRILNEGRRLSRSEMSNARRRVADELVAVSTRGREAKAAGTKAAKDTVSKATTDARIFLKGETGAKTLPIPKIGAVKPADKRFDKNDTTITENDVRFALTNAFARFTEKHQNLSFHQKLDIFKNITAEDAEQSRAWKSVIAEQNEIDIEAAVPLPATPAELVDGKVYIVKGLPSRFDIAVNGFRAITQ